jgi:hypothetical protein
MAALFDHLVALLLFANGTAQGSAKPSTELFWVKIFSGGQAKRRRQTTLARLPRWRQFAEVSCGTAQILRQTYLIDFESVFKSIKLLILRRNPFLNLPDPTIFRRSIRGVSA